MISCTLSRSLLHAINVDGYLLTEALDKDEKIPGNFIIQLEPETTQLVKNPLMGWAVYSDACNPDMNFWNKFDSIIIDGFEIPLKVSDYATHLYIRWPWSAFERDEGEYAWEYDSFLKLLEKGALERGLKLAYRIYVDSRDYSTMSTPEYVREAGAKGFIGNTKKWSPYPDDPVFQIKYEKFIRAFAQRYNNSDMVDYIDGYGLGKWGEGHSVIYKDENNREKVFKWIIDLYADSFTEIPLAINYHRLIASEKDWNTPDATSKYLLGYAFEKGYILRHDAFGMGEYYGTFEEQIVEEQFPSRPIIAESGWWHNGTTSWKNDPNNYNTWSDVWQQTLNDALDAHANTLDLRNISETQSWFATSFPLVEQFISEGGYRIYPDSISIPVNITDNSGTIQIIHRWKNLGVGVCPTNIKQWRNKYKTTFALIDKADHTIKKLYFDYNAQPVHWLKDKPVEYKLEILKKDIPEGNYIWALAITDTIQNNMPGINLAVKNKLIADGWLPIANVTINKSGK